ncbi:cache domain-containing protein [Arcobacter sp. s6]|uniref:cache domain-containing protein n=1 Tax=Arcobacter sp. s6 TaxID=3230363 RepID=UPI0034A0868F
MKTISNEKLILKIIKYAPLIFILIASILTTTYISLNYINTLKIEKEKIEDEYIKFNKELIENNINSIYNYINKQNARSNEYLKIKLKHEINNAHDIMFSIYERFKNEKSKEEIIEIMKASLEHLRFNDGRGYFSIHTMEGINIFHPIYKEFEGTSVLNRRDINGDYPVKEAIAIAKAKTEGFFSWYYYKLKDKSKELKKLGIVKEFEPYNFIITTAEFEEDFENQVKMETIAYIKDIGDSEKGYVFIIDKNADFLLTRTKYFNVKDIDKENIFFKSYWKLKNSNDKDIYSQYEYITNSEKISYLKKVEIYDWVIGTGFNLDKLILKIKEKQKELEKEYDEHMYVTLIIATSMTILFLIASLLISKLLEKKFLIHKKDLEKQISENKKQKETLIRAQEVAHIGDWKLDLQTNKAYWSDEIIRILGLDRKDKNMIGIELLKNKMFPEDIAHLEESISNCINKGIDHQLIYRIKRTDTDIRWIDCRGKLEEDKLFMIGTIQDITDNKNLEIEKKQKDELLYQQSKMAAMGEMIGNIAHQWRQPLSTISTASTGTKLQKEMNCLSDEDLYSALTSINNSAQYLSKTIDDFRDFFNPSNNKVSEFDISDAISKTLNLVKAQFVAKDIEIIKNIEEYKINSIENELIQVLVNLLNNARDALDITENQRRLIFINTYSKDNTLYLEVQDNAKGIPEDIIDRIFEPYFTTKHQSQGTGIGLYMSKEIIEKHLNGKLFVSNKEYTFDGYSYLGACFTIEILKN